MNLAQIIEPHPADSVAFSFRGDEVTYGELRRRCARVRRSLADRGISQGERVALVFGATPEFAVAYFGVLGAGAVTVPLNPNSPVAEIDGELRAVRTALVLVPSGGSDSAGALWEQLRGLGHDVAELSSLDGSGDPDASHGDVSADALAGIVDLEPDDQAALLFTSGTAGSPKAAVLTHGSLLANIEQVELRVGLAASANDVGILAVPPFHILGLNAVLGVQVYVGGRLVLLERFDPAMMLEAIASEGVTVLAGVPQMFAALADFEGATGSELASVRLACSGAAPLAEATAERFEQKFGVPVWQGYGLTEASPTVTFPDLSGRRQVSSVGIPLPGVEVRVVDPDGHDVETGDPGEILVRGPNVFAGYFEDALATSVALDRKGWLHTGDIAVMSDDCSLTIVDRQKDLIIVSGFNVFPAEVEHVLEEHPLVEEAAVVGVPDDTFGETVRAFVVPVASTWPEDAATPEGLTTEDLATHCMRQLARYKCPHSVVFVRELPRGIQGKVLRRAVS
ncbi:MAG: AMP-binding protein [Acidimicrobiales bacterium]